MGNSSKVSTEDLVFEKITITPTMATIWLQHNRCNRPLRPTNIKRYAQDMLANNWDLTHQGIAFDMEGNLVDGQNRLHAIILSNSPTTLVVAHYNKLFTAMGLLVDIGSTRTSADLLAMSPRITEPISFLFRELCSRREGSEAIRIARLFDKHPDLPPWIAANIPSTCRKVVSSACIRAAVILAHTQGFDWVEQYNNLVNLRFEEMGNFPGLASLYRKLIQYEGNTAGREFRYISFGTVYAAASSSKRIVQFRDVMIEDAWKSATEAFSKYSK